MNKIDFKSWIKEFRENYTLYDYITDEDLKEWYYKCGYTQEEAADALWVLFEEYVEYDE